MKSKTPILTVAIPTFNRSTSLEKNLKYLKNQKQLFKILVSDNNSTDNTKAVVEKYQKIMPNLNYNRNNSNLGYSGNILKLYLLADTRYIWFLSDDDEVLPSAIDIILNSLTKYNATVTLFNHVRIDPFNKELIDGVGEDILYKDIHRFDDYPSILRSCFISIVVIEKRLDPAILNKIFDGNNVYFQLSLVILLLNDRFRFCEVASPIIFRNTTYESGEFFKFILTDWLDAIFIVKSKLKRPRFTNWAKKEILNALQLYLSQKIGIYRYNGRPSLRTIHKIIKYYGFSSFVIFMFPIIYLLTPTFFLRFIYKNKLNKIYDKKTAFKVYNKNLNRIFKNKINSGFTGYR